MFVGEKKSKNLRVQQAYLSSSTIGLMLHLHWMPRGFTSEIQICRRIARRLLGPDRLLGCSTYARPDLVREAMRPDVRADYLGSGAVFGSPTKHKCTSKGVDHLSELSRVIAFEAGSRKVPLLAIGGVDLDSAGPCVQAGADGVAVVSGLLRYEDAAETQAAAEKMLAAVRDANDAKGTHAA